MDFELKPDINSQILFTYDLEPDVIKLFDMTTIKKMIKIWYSSRYRPVFPERFDFETNKGLKIFFEDKPVFSQERGMYTLKSLKEIYHIHIHWTNFKSSVHNCVYYIHEPNKINVFSILKISATRYLFAYHPTYLNKIDVEQIVFELFIDNA